MFYLTFEFIDILLIALSFAAVLKSNYTCALFTILALILKMNLLVQSEAKQSAATIRMFSRC